MTLKRRNGGYFALLRWMR